MEIYFATGNENKFREAREILAPQIQLKHFKFNHREIRSESIEEIALDSVRAAYEKLQKPVFVDDSGLFLEGFQNFPGPYSKWILIKLGIDGILKLLEGKNKNAHFKTCIAYKDKTQEKTFIGRVDGKIIKEKRGENGFGYDPVFVPNGETLTFAQGIDLKNKLSHRYRALSMLKEHFL